MANKGKGGFLWVFFVGGFLALALLGQAEGQGGQCPPLTPAEVIGQVHRDLASLPPQSWPWIRYLTLYNLPPEWKALALKILPGHVNALSREVDLEPLAIVPGTGETLLRLNLKDYGWPGSLWAQLKDVDPFFHRPELFQGKKVNVLAPWLITSKAQEATLQQVVEWTQSRTPVVRGDWFFFQTAIQEDHFPGYYDFLGIKDLATFQKLVRFDAVQAAQLEQRRVVFFSEITLEPRRVERTNTPLGGLWRTSDSAKAVDKGNPIRVLDNNLVFDATEQFAPLPNKLPAWFLADGKGKKQDKAPDKVVGGDKWGGGVDTRLHVNLSCIRCHMGLTKHESGVKDFAENKIESLSSPFYDVFRERKRQYLRQVGDDLANDRRSYRAAILQASGMEPQEYAKGYQELFSWYADGRIDPKRSAADLGTTEENWVLAMKAFKQKTGDLDPVLSSLANGGQVPRTSWEEAFPLANLVLRGFQSWPANYSSFR